MLWLDDTTWSCGTTCGGNGNDPTFDLTTAEKVGFFVTVYDVLASRTNQAIPLLSPADRTRMERTLEEQIDLFVAVFWKGGWQLWNGNNWTPHLCVAAVEWATVFYHERTAKAVEVLPITSDVLWLHRR